MPKNLRLTRALLRIFSLFICISLLAGFAGAPNTYAAGAFLSVPTPIAPSDMSTTTPVTNPPLGIPSFMWSPVEGAVSYRLQVDNEIGFNPPIMMEIVTKNTSHTPTVMNSALFSDGPWYWRVRVEQPAPAGDYTYPRQFTKDWTNMGANAPTLVSPAEGASLYFYDSPVFSWNPVLGAARYCFQISTTMDGFGTTCTATTVTTTYQHRERQSNATYYWRVVPLDVGDHQGGPSEVRSFTAAFGTGTQVPTLLAPADESVPTFTPTFRWTAVDGTQRYYLQYTTEESCDFSAGGGLSVSLYTNQTSYTPLQTFPNDARYCWRVRAESSLAVGNWSETWHFQKQWNLAPILLTPTNLYQSALYPIYSWTPVPGAAYYQIEIATNPNFNPMLETVTTANTTYTPQNTYVGDATYYWRVRAYDGSNNASGTWSSVAQFRSRTTTKAPSQVYPLYYYSPTSYGEITMNPYEDRTVALPIFKWHRVLNSPAAGGGIAAAAYRIQVATTPYFSSLAWQYDTENTAAAPISANNFVPAAGTDYYWRVCVLNQIGGDCVVDPENATEWWSQTWRARFDASRVIPPTAGTTPVLLRPVQGQEIVEATPLLEWWPMVGATQYQVEISRDPSFATDIVDSRTVTLPAYAPAESLAQRFLNRTDFGTFYWRVRGYKNGAWGPWSGGWRFQIAAQSHWTLMRTAGAVENRLLIGSDASDPAPVNAIYNLSTLHAAQSNTDWYFGWNADLTGTATYALLIDLNHVDGSGGSTVPERAYQITTTPAHRPEYVVYVDKVGGVINASNVWVFGWNGSSWNYGQTLISIGGTVTAASGHIEVKLPNSAIGMNQDTSSASVMVVSVNVGTNQVADSVPSDPQAPGTGLVSRFSAVSERMNLIHQPTTTSGDPSTIPSFLPFSWDWPTGSGTTTPFAGSISYFDIDPNYSPPHEASFQISSNTPYFSGNNITFINDVVGDNIYYWKVQLRYLVGGTGYLGAWTGGWSFQRVGLEAKNLSTSVDFATPTFSWDRAEGARNYNLQVSADSNFGSNVINETTANTSYTPQTTLAPGRYFWRVRVNRQGNIGSDWSDVKEFTLALPVPTGLTPSGNVVIRGNPTLCWNPLIMLEPGTGQPLFAASRYRVWVSKAPDFSSTIEQIDTHSHCWTPTNGYEDGQYYWKVAMMDGNNRVGNYSPSVMFVKQYPVTTLIRPLEPSASTPTFEWAPVAGAARYRLEISKSMNFSTLYDSVTTVNTTYTPIMIYDENVTYYWRVAIIDHSGRQGPFTGATLLIGDENKAFLPMIVR